MRRYHLSVGFETSLTARLVGLLFIGLFLLVGAMCGGYALGMLALYAVAAAPAAPAVFAYLPFVGAALGLLSATLYMVLAFAAAMRQAAWLDGTWLTVRRLRRRTVDLAAARLVGLQPTTERLRAPAPVGVLTGPGASVAVLVVTAESGTVRLRLASRERVQLPAHQLLAIADALSAARCPGAAEVVHWLRGTAAGVLSRQAG